MRLSGAEVLDFLQVCSIDLERMLHLLMLALTVNVCYRALSATTLRSCSQRTPTPYIPCS